MAELDNATPLARIDCLETQVATLNRAVFGDVQTHTESLFQKMDKLQTTTDTLNRRLVLLLVAMMFVVGITCMIILQLVWSATH